MLFNFYGSFRFARLDGSGGLFQDDMTLLTAIDFYTQNQLRW